MGVICPLLTTTFRLKRANNEKIWLLMKKATKNVFQYGKAFGPSGYGQIIWHFQTGPGKRAVD